MAFNVGISSKEAFSQLKKLTPRQRVDYVKNYSQGPATILSMLTPAEFAELFPKYTQKGLPDVSGFREAISRKSNQKQDDINFGLSQGAKTVEQAEQYGQWRRRFGNEDPGRTTSTLGGGEGSYSGPIKGWWTADRQKYAVEYLMKNGKFTQYGAAAAVARMTKEAPGGPGSSNNIGGGHWGIAQWGINRRGREMAGASFDEQLAWYVKETMTTEKAAGDRFRSATNAQQGAYAAASFERAEGWKESGGRTDILMERTPVDTVYNNAFGKPPQTSMGDVSRVSTKSGGYYGNNEQCVSLSKHFSGLGAASDWKVKSGNITAGTVIATMSYNDGSGGKMAKDMPDRQSHYHTGIALSAPNESGNVLILEQFVGQPARVRMININNYNGERWGVVEGGEPNAGTMKAVEIGKSLANPDQLALIQGGSTAPTAQASVQVNPVQQAPTARPTLSTNEQQQQYPADQQPQQQAANQQTAKVEKVDKSKKTYETFKFDPDKYYNEVNTKHPEAKFFGYDRDRIMGDTYKGFEEAQAAGAIKWNKKSHEIQILDPNHEKVQAIYKDMQDNNIDRNAFLTKTEAGGSGTAKVSRGRKRPSVRDSYTPEVTATGLNKESKLVDYKGSIALSEIGITQEQLNAIREAKASIESSGGKYDLRGGSSKRFSGAYQMGGNEIKMAAKVLGEQAPVVAVRKRKTPVANEEFLRDPQMQERYHEAFLVAQHRQLMKNKTYAAMGPEKRSEILGFAHNAGAGGASRYLKTSQSKADAFGTQPQKFASHVRTQLAGLQVAKNMEAEAKTKLAATPAQSTPASPSSVTTTRQATNAPQQQQPKSIFDTLDPYVSQSAAANVSRGTTTPKQSSQTTPRAEPIQRTQPEIPIGVTPAPPNVTPETMQPVPEKFQQDVMKQIPSEKSQKETIMDASLTRQTREFPTASLERAMGKARGFETGTGADGHHHSTTSLG